MSLDGKLEDVERRLKEKKKELADTPKDTAVKLKADIDKLNTNKEKLHKQKTALDAKLLEGKILSPQEERRFVPSPSPSHIFISWEHILNRIHLSGFLKMPPL